MNDAELQRLYRQATARPDWTRVDCPSSEGLLNGLAGKASRRERQALADHMSRCADCAEEYRAVAELKPWAATAAHRLGWGPAPTHRLELPRLWVGLFAWRAATVAVLVVLTTSGVVLWQRKSPAPASDRGRSSLTPAVQPADRAALPAPPDQLTWSAVSDAASYKVILYDFESTPLWDSPEVTVPSVTLPATIRAKVTLGKPHYWRIIVTKGIDRMTSDLFQFTVTTQ